MVVYDLFRIVHAAVAYLDGASVEYFTEFVVFRKHSFTKDRNRWPMFVLTFLLNGGLYQRILFLCLFFLLFVVVGSYWRVY